MRVLIMANGNPPGPDLAHEYAGWADLLVAANGGAGHALDLGLQPDVVIGDLDSLSQAQQARLEAGGARFVAHPPAKDETDLELALLHAVERGADQIVVLGALGGRLDQTLANVLLLSLPALAGRDVRLVDEAQTTFLIRHGASLHGQPGDTVSLIPLGGPAHGVTTQGLAYPLSDESLPFGPALGVSNALTAQGARVQVRDGLVWCIHLKSEEV